jgi:hypothetical protein
LDYIEKFLDDYEHKEHVNVVKQRQEHVTDGAIAGVDVGDVDGGDVSSAGKRNARKNKKN